MKWDGHRTKEAMAIKIGYKFLGLLFYDFNTKAFTGLIWGGANASSTELNVSFAGWPILKGAVTVIWQSPRSILGIPFPTSVAGHPRWRIPKTLIASPFITYFRLGKSGGLSIFSRGFLRRKKTIGSKRWLNHDETEIYNRITSFCCTTLHFLQTCNLI